MGGNTSGVSMHEGGSDGSSGDKVLTFSLLLIGGGGVVSRA